MQVFALIQTIYKIIKGLLSLAKFIQDNKDEIWFQDCHRTIVAIGDAKNDDQRKVVAANLRDIINRL